MGANSESFDRNTSLLFQVVTQTPEGEVWELTEISEIGDLVAARKYWRAAVRKHPDWRHTIELANGTKVLRNDPTQKGKTPKEVWISKIHLGVCQDCHIGDIIPSVGTADGVCTICGPVQNVQEHLAMYEEEFAENLAARVKFN
jgi:hypothetical protein